MNQEFMKEKPVMPLVISMALPMTISMLVNALYNIIDSYFVAKISEDAMTALSLVFPLQNFVNAVVIGFAIGVNAAMAYFLGAGKQQMASKMASLGTFLNMIHGLVLGIAAILVMPGFLGMFTDEADMIHMGVQYSGIVFLFSIPNAASLCFEKIFQAVGRMKTSMICMQMHRLMCRKIRLLRRRRMRTEPLHRRLKTQRSRQRCASRFPRRRA